MPSLRGSSQYRDRAQVSLIIGEFFYHLNHQGSPNRQEKDQNREMIIAWIWPLRYSKNAVGELVQKTWASLRLVTL